VCSKVDSSFDICGNSGTCCIAIQLAVTWSRPLCDIGAALQAVVLIGVRWVLYKLKRWHYYLLGEAAVSALNFTKSCRHPCCVFAHPQLASGARVCVTTALSVMVPLAPAQTSATSRI